MLFDNRVNKLVTNAQYYSNPDIGYMNKNFKYSMKKITIEILSGAVIIILGVMIRSGISMAGFSAPKSAGTLFILAGICWILYVMLNQKKIIGNYKKAEKSDKVAICPKCRTPLFVKNTPDMKCSECEVDLEEIDGFYDRHPDFKKRKREIHNMTLQKTP